MSLERHRVKQQNMPRNRFSLAKMTFKGHSRLSEITYFDIPHTIYYYRSIVTMTLS